jgi:hypothetical protein
MVYDILDYSYCGLFPSSSTGKSRLFQTKGPFENTAWVTKLTYLKENLFYTK